MRVSSQEEHKELPHIQLTQINMQQVQYLQSQILKYFTVMILILHPLLPFWFFWPNGLISSNFSSSKVSTDTRI